MFFGVAMLIEVRLLVHPWKYVWLARASFFEICQLPRLAFVKTFQRGAEYGTERRVKSAPLQERNMVDRFRIRVKGGDGGDGCASFRKSQHSRYSVADGGNGGRGGDVTLVCSPRVWDFSNLQHHFNGKKGGKGLSKRKVGSRGLDKIVQVPIGTVIHLVSGCIPSVQTSLPDGRAHVETSHQSLYESVDDQVNLCRSSVGVSVEVAAWESHATYMTNKVMSTNMGINVEPRHEELDSDSYSQEICLSATSIDATATNLSYITKHSEVEKGIGFTGTEDDTENNDTESNEEKSLSDGFGDDGGEREDRQIKQFSVAELITSGQSLVVACGGEGGRGNAAMARGWGNQKSLPSKEHEPGHPGTDAFLVLELKTIADVGLVGAPNAGKSTLLGSLSRAKPRIGHYAFTTLRPNLGMLEYEDYFSITVADIPGLIKGAHENRGLGHAFLRHIERTKALAYVVDLVAGLGDRNGIPPWDQFEELKFELEKYQPGLSNRPSLVVATKFDEAGADEVLRELTLRLPSTPIFGVCAVLDEGIHELRMGIRELIEGLQRES